MCIRDRLKAVGLIDNPGGIAQLIQYLAGHLVAQVIGIRTEVEKNIAWRGRGLMCGIDCLKFLQAFRHRCAGQTWPHGGTNADYGIKFAFVIAEVYGFKQSGKPREHIAGGLLAAVLDFKDKKESCAGRFIYYVLNRHGADFTHPVDSQKASGAEMPFVGGRLCNATVSGVRDRPPGGNRIHLYNDLSLIHI